MSAAGERKILNNFVGALFQDALKRGRAKRDAITTAGALDDFVARFRKDLFSITGAVHDHVTAVRAAVRKKWRLGPLEVWNLAFQVRSGDVVTANVLRPPGGEPLPAVLFFCGHYPEGRLHEVYRSRCLELAAAGFVVLTYDPPAQGERVWFSSDDGRSIYNDPVFAHAHAGVLCLRRGDHLLRYFLHEAFCLYHWLSGQPFVDKSRIAVTGNSGGGLMSFVFAALEPTVAACATATFPCSMGAIQASGEPQDAEQTWPGFVALGYDHAALAAAVCPRPLCLLAAEKDFFPIAGTRELCDEARRLYALRGEKEKFSLYVEDAKHIYTPGMLRHAAQFFAKHLNHLNHAADLRIPTDPGVDQWRSGMHHVRDVANVLTLPVGPAAKKNRANNPPLHNTPKNLTRKKIASFSSSHRCERLCWNTAEGLSNSALRIFAEAPSSSAVIILRDGTESLEDNRTRIEKILKTCGEVWVPNFSGHGEFYPENLHPYFPKRSGLDTLHKLCEDLAMIAINLADIWAAELDLLRLLICSPVPLDLYCDPDWADFCAARADAHRDNWKFHPETTTPKLNPQTARLWLRAVT